MQHFNIIQIQKEVDGIRDWFKYEQDNAFIDIIDGYITSGKDRYFEHVKDFNVVIQAGGYCGIHPRLFSQIFKTVYTFEPDFKNFYCLNLNCFSPNIIKIQGALGDVPRLVGVKENHPSNFGMHTVEERGDGIVPMFTIDQLNLPACDLIQLDTEGYELGIIRGAHHTIDQFRPVIVVEDTNTKIEKTLDWFGYKKKSTSYRDTVYSC